jgi:hypothetical protein
MFKDQKECDLPLKTSKGGNFVPSAATTRTIVALLEFEAESQIDTVRAPTSWTVVLLFISKYTAV